MKKSLIVVAALGLSGAALAQSAVTLYEPGALPEPHPNTGATQSSVTLYGVADAGVGRIKSSGFRTPSTPDDSGKTQFISASLMNNADSRLGVRGVEDLGGGLRAGFAFETGLDLDDGGGANGQTASVFWARQANVSLTGGWGSVKLGRQYTPSTLVTSVFELTPGNNYSLLGNAYRYVSFGTRVNSAFAYVTPDFSGLSGQVAFVSKNDRPDGRNVWDMGAVYINGPLVAGASVNKATGGKASYQLGGRYNFGHFALVASYTQATNVLKGDANALRRGFELGGNVSYGAFSVTLDFSRDTRNEWIATGKKYTNGLLELKYALSRRTFVYGAFLRLDGQSNYGMGVRHNF